MWYGRGAQELLNESVMFDHLAGKAAEGFHPPTTLHDYAAIDESREEDVGAVVVRTNCFGIRIEVPRGALPPSEGLRISLRTISESSVRYLAEGGSDIEGDSDTEEPQGSYSLPFSPIIRVDFPAFVDGEPPELGAPSAVDFAKPLTLIIPHCFDPRDGEEAIAMVAGAPHGATCWQTVAHDGDEDDEAIEFRGQEMRIPVPYAGIFGAFAKTSAQAVVFAARFHVFTMDELPSTKPSTLRVHLCPELPNQIEEMQIAESSNWGLSTCVGASKVVYLTKGVRFCLSYLENEEEMTWVGLRGQVSFVLPASGAGGRAASPEDTDRRRVLDGSISIEMLEGIGPIASRVRLCARRAGIPAGSMQMHFSTRIRSQGAPQAPVLRLRERTPHDFTVTWRKPLGVDEYGREADVDITHYQLEIATTSPSGTYYPWQALWCGPGVESPDPRLLVAQKLEDAAKVEKLTRVLEEERLEAREAIKASGSLAARITTKTEKRSGKPACSGMSLTAKMNSKLDKRPSSAKAPSATSEPVFSYSLPVEPSLFGKLRIRCWAKDDECPSRSTQVILPRWNGSPGVDNKLQMEINARAAHFAQLTQHVSSGFSAVGHRVGNPVGPNIWGGDRPPPPPPPTPKEIAMGNVMAPVPYDVPRLATDLDGIEAAGGALACFYRECGVIGGGGGELFGLRIDHVLHAIAGTPTLNGGSSPSRTLAGLREPLIALCEVAYADVLLELFNESSVLKPQWQFVDEKVYGVVARVAYHRTHYASIENEVKAILHALVEIWETARQCQAEEALPFHLQHEQYARAVKRKLAAELTSKLKQLSWRLSTRLLELQLAVRKASQADLVRLVPRKVSNGAGSGDPVEPREVSDGAGSGTADEGPQLPLPQKALLGGKKKGLFRSLKRAVTIQRALSSVYRRVQAKSLSTGIEEMSRAADERAAAESETQLREERAAEERATVRLQAEERGRRARARAEAMREEYLAAKQAAFLQRLAAEEATIQKRLAAEEAALQHAVRTEAHRARVAAMRKERADAEEAARNEAKATPGPGLFRKRFNLDGEQASSQADNEEPSVVGSSASREPISCNDAGDLDAVALRTQAAQPQATSSPTKLERLNTLRECNAPTIPSKTSPVTHNESNENEPRLARPVTAPRSRSAPGNGYLGRPASANALSMVEGRGQYSSQVEPATPASSPVHYSTCSDSSGSPTRRRRSSPSTEWTASNLGMHAAAWAFEALVLEAPAPSSSTTTISKVSLGSTASLRGNPMGERSRSAGPHPRRHRARAAAGHTPFSMPLIRPGTAGDKGLSRVSLHNTPHWRTAPRARDQDALFAPFELRGSGIGMRWSVLKFDP